MATGGRTAGRAAGRAAEHVIGKAVKRAGVKDAEKVAAKKTAKQTAKRARKRLSIKDDPYQRPSKFRRDTRTKAWNAAKGPDGKVRDPLTGKVIKKGEPWHMGHKPGYEFRKHRASAQKRGITRKQFLDEHNEHTHYRPELPKSNESHLGENTTGDYYGP